MKQVVIRRGRVVVDEVPAPIVEPGKVLVRVDHSCISVGTELSGIRTSAVPLWQRAVRQPGKVRQLAEMALTQGLGTTNSIIQGKLSGGEATGYSAAGLVVDIGAGTTDLRIGDRVACAGAQSAHHAEIIRVARNLVVPIPDEVSFADASTVTLGAIALQGVRRAQPTIGESFVVIGLGVIGQLTVQLLRANGCRVIGTDLDPERIRLAIELGMDVGLDPASTDGSEQVARLTDGVGADAVIITATTSSDAVVSSAFRMCRKKGRVVLVGDVGLNLDRADFYEKELDFFISTSYGPGRYDQNYEELGLDYPVGYVRWTENRNMSEYLRLVAAGRLQLGPLVSAKYQIEDARLAYESLQAPQARPMIVLLEYASTAGLERRRIVTSPRIRTRRAGALRVGLIGAGGFAKQQHLPNIQGSPSDFHLQAVASRTGHNAMATAMQFGAKYATTEYQRLLEDPEVDLVLIATRHDLHAKIALEALRHGKHVLVEKPLALAQAELDEIVAFYDTDGERADLPVLLTGFNRRFSRYAHRIAEITRSRSNPMILNYRVNAGYIPLDNWVHSAEGGGRNRGEACHVYDLFTFITGSRVAKVHAQAIHPQTAHYSPTDNFVATMTFEDGSVGTLTYTALGARDHSKEQLEIFVDGKVVALDDYRKLVVTGGSAKGLVTVSPEKGQKEELKVLADTVRNGGEWPIPLWQQAQATEIAFGVESFLTGGR